MAILSRGRRAFGVILLMLGTAFVGLSTRAGTSVGRTTLWLSNAPFEVSPGTVRVTLTTTRDDGTVTSELPVELAVEKSTTASRGFVRIPVTGTVIVHRLKGSTVRLGLVPPWTAYLAGLGVLCWFIGLPYAFLRTENLYDESRKPVGPWYYLLLEPSGGLSLSRVQLLIWFLPAIAIYAGVSLPLHRFAPMDTTLAVLLGLSGATTLLSSAVSPPATVVVPSTKSQIAIQDDVPPPPFYGTAGTRLPSGSASEIPRLDARDLVTDWQGGGDVSRYQYLLVSLVGAAVFTIAFLRTVRIPAIPEQFLYLIAASQATYLGTKAVGAAKSPGQPERN
ncbi:MAG TPA: hypothetical protein VFF17_14200 [Thermoanaerobaculia bacterium]|nr:hypothetical protein [Thermoanaerobaculia bacterium]